MRLFLNQSDEVNKEMYSSQFTPYEGGMGPKLSLWNPFDSCQNIEFFWFLKNWPLEEPCHIVNVFKWI